MRRGGEYLSDHVHAFDYLAERGIADIAFAGVEIGRFADRDEEVAHRGSGGVAGHRDGAVDMEQPGLAGRLVRDGKECHHHTAIDAALDKPIFGRLLVETGRAQCGEKEGTTV